MNGAIISCRTEWGNPQNETILQSMMTYSPYHLIKKGISIPNILISCGMVDPRVPYWEPIKFVAKLRKSIESSANSKLLLRVSSSGHFGSYDTVGRLEWITFVLHNT
jgi:oligopeptidase B